MTDALAQQVEPWAVTVEGGCAPVVIEHLREYAVTVDQPADVLVVTMGDQGPPGAPGAPGPEGGAALQRTAGTTLSALRAVYELDGQMHYLDYRDGAHIDLLLGITLTAAGAGQPVNVQRSGAIDDNGWSWTPGRIWLGMDGALTQTPPADGYDVLVGAAVSATRIILNLTDAVELE